MSKFLRKLKRKAKGEQKTAPMECVEVQEFLGKSSLGPTAKRLGELLRRGNSSLAVAESCTGGAIASSIVSVPGSSDYFLCGVVSYSNGAKEEFLGVSGETLRAHGAVSEEVARDMARGMRERSGATLGLSTTGISGPGGGSAEKPVGTVWIGLSSPEGEEAFYFLLPSERNVFREQVAHLALALVCELLLEESVVK